MGCFSCLGGKSARRVRLMFVGLDGAGKSTLLQTIAGDPEEPTVPTVGFHNVTLRRERTFDSGFDVDVFDLGGGKRIRGIWKLVEMVEKKPGQWQQTVEITIEIEGEEKPALICEWITQFFV